MAANFRLFISKKRDEIVLKCMGMLDGSSACEILRRLEECTGSRHPVIIDLKEVSELHPLGMEVLKSGINGRYLKLGKTVKLLTNDR